MSKLKILEWEENVELCLVAIYTPLPDYKLAYNVNSSIHSVYFKSHHSIQSKIDKKSFYFSLYKSEQTKNTHPIYLLDNLSFTSDGTIISAGLFDEMSAEERTLIKTNLKWRYLLFSEDSQIVSYCTTLSKIKHINFSHAIDFQSLRKPEQDTLISITYDE